jgi:predicted dehydrogenase
MNKIRYGIIGLGGWARHVHIPNLNQIAQAEITAVCSRGEANRASALAAAKGRPKAFADYRDLLASSDVDAALIATPNNTHATMAREALRAGKHVLCEKPMGLNVPECDEVIRAAEESGRVFMIGHELRYAPVVREVQAMIARGDIGQLKMVRTDLMRRPLGMANWRLDPAAYGGVMMDLGIHYLDLLCLLTGGVPRKVSGAGSDATGIGYVNQCQVLVDFDNRLLGAFGMCLYCKFGGEITIAAFGTEGRMEAGLRAGQIALYDHRKAAKEVRSIPAPTDHKIYDFPGTYEVHTSFIECVLSGKKPEADGRVGRQAVAISLAAQEAMATGKTVISNQ